MAEHRTGGTRIRRAGVAVAVVALTVIGAAACTSSKGGSGSHPSSTSSKPSAPTVWQQTLDKVKPDGTVDVSTALTAFALAIGPVPGITPPAGPRDDITSGTIAIRWVTRVWSKLTPAQQAAINSDLGASSPTATHSIIGLNKAAPPPSIQPNVDCQTKDSAGAEPYRGVFDAIVDEMETHLWPLRVRDHVFFVENTQQVVKKTEVVKTAMAYTVGCVGTDRNVDRISGCTIHIEPNGSAHRGDAGLVAQVVIHELTHCFINSRWGRQAEDLMPDWYAEGAPDWVAATLATGNALRGWWHKYLDRQTRPLSQLTYDGLGFFVHLAESSIDVWKAIATIGTALAKSPSTTDGWNAAGANANKGFLDSWGSSFARGRYPGSAWQTSAPNLDDQYQPPITRENDLANDGSVPFSSNAEASGLLQLNVTAEIVQVQPDAAASGRISLGNETDATLTAAADQTYCTLATADCKCPEDSAGADTKFTPMEKGIQYVGLTGGLAKASVQITGHSFEEFCKANKSPLIGTWRARSTTITSDNPVASYLTTGGAGYTMTISPKGQLTLSYAGMAKPSYSVQFHTQALTAHASVTVSGTDTAKLDLKRRGVWHASNPSIGIKETAHFDAGGVVAGAGMFAGPLPNATATWAIAGKTLTISAAGHSTHATWVFTRVK